jgi:hypothetical protein
MLLASDVQTDPVTLARTVQADVTELRGLAFERDVPVRVIGDDAASLYLTDRIQAFHSAEEISLTELALQTIGLLPPRFDVMGAFVDVMRKQAAGYYDPTTGAFYLLDDLPAASARVVMAHELTHALEDQHFDLDARLREVLDDDDKLLARAAIHEGSATLLMMAYLVRAIATGTIDAEALASFQEMSQTATLRDMPPALQREIVAPYLLGAAFLARGDLVRAAGEFPAADVDQAYRDPPASSEQILHPGKYWGPEPRDAPRSVPPTDAGTALGPGFERTAAGVMGELGLGPLVGAPTPSDVKDLQAQDASRWTNASAAGWGGDRWELWQDGDTAVVVLSTVWDTTRDAEEFLSGLRTNGDLHAHVELHARREADRVAVVAGVGRRRAQKVLASVLARGVEPTPSDR